MSGKQIVLGILAYLGILIVISFLFAEGDQFVRFHIRQGLLLLIAEIAVWLLSVFFVFLWILPGIPFVIDVLNLIIAIYIIIGIVNVAMGHERELPVIGKYASRFKV